MASAASAKGAVEGRARRRSGPDLARRWLCAAIFSDPQCVSDARSHEVTAGFEIALHHHDDLLQLDLIDGCEGELIGPERRLPIRGMTLLVTYPGQAHGYRLLPGRPPSEVWLVKIRVDDGWRWLGDRPLPTAVTGLGRREALAAAMAGFVSDWTPRGVGTTALGQLAQAICLWPGSAAEAEADAARSGGEPGGDAASVRVRRAAETLGRRYHDPPDLAALAQAANLSQRHFARRFRAQFGCTPHQYVTNHRLDVARSFLLRTQWQVSDVAVEMGFSSAAAFSRWFTRLSGQSPRAFRSDPHHF